MSKKELSLLAGDEKLVAISEPDNQLFVDLDSKKAVKEFLNRVKFLRVQTHFADEGKLIEKITLTKSRNGNTHAICNLKMDVPIWARNALRAALGSDPYREIHNIVRTLDGSQYPVIFFERVK